MGLSQINLAIVGASGYTGADAVRLLAAHPRVRIAALTGNTHAGQELAEIYPQFADIDVPTLERVEEVNWKGIDAAICGLPHSTAQDVIARIPAHVRVIDMSADFRLRDAEVYNEWYGRTHDAPGLLADAVYGLTEHYRAQIASARLVACPGCYPTAALTLLLPLVQAG
ncbi:MAG: N-acetyl-gamma-glutamyl-phosphate reductase, partial [Pseudomonadota bacterium]|nr:N-acetyl-gamma-glutamyl-phosphate reductase [Pseudomonadota bacterium]